MVPNVSPSEIVTALYSQDVTDPRQVTDRVRFVVPVHGTPLRRLFERLFAIRFAQWIFGVGHLNHPSIRGGVVPEAEFLKCRNDPRTRPRTFLRVASQSDQRQSSSTWNITVSSLAARRTSFR